MRLDYRTHQDLKNMFGLGFAAIPHDSWGDIESDRYRPYRPKHKDTSSEAERRVEHIELRTAVERALSTLTPREEEVIRSRFGIGMYHPYPLSLEEVGISFDVARERIRQIEAKAIRKLRHPVRAKSLIEFLDEHISKPKLLNPPARLLSKSTLSPEPINPMLDCAAYRYLIKNKKPPES